MDLNFAPLMSSNTAIRLLKIHPSDDYNAPIEGPLITVDLSDNCPLFTAISYEWGPPSSNTIIINGRTLHIRDTFSFS